MGYVIVKSAGDDFSFTTEFVPGEVGHPYAYAGVLAARITKAMKCAVEHGVHLTGDGLCAQCGSPAWTHDVRDHAFIEPITSR